MSTVFASGVPFADVLNEAATTYGVSPALLQGMLDQDGAQTFVLPAPAQQFADQLVRDASGGAALQSNSTTVIARANILAAAWYLANVLEMRGHEMDAVSYFYGNTPRSRIKAAKIISGTYERRRRQWT